MRRVSIIVGSCLVAAIGVVGFRAGYAQETWEQRVGDWRYPNATLRNGGYVGNGPSGANRYLSYSRAAMTTEDSVDDVARYYEKKTGGVLVPVPYAGYGRTTTDDKVNLFEDDSKQRPLTLRIFQQHSKDLSLTLMISRAEGEKFTHIYWSLVNH